MESHLVTVKKIQEQSTLKLINCLQFILGLKQFKIKNCYKDDPRSIYKELFKRLINPLYLPVLILISLLAYVAVSSDFTWDLWFPPVEYDVEGTPQLIAGVLFTDWILPFEIISILLIVATAAAIALAYDIKKRSSNA